MKNQTAPIRNLPQYKRPWEGNCAKKPWDYEITAVIPVMDTFEQLEICIRLLKSQTIRPYIVVIDTGSIPEEFEKIDRSLPIEQWPYVANASKEARRRRDTLRTVT